MFKAGARCVDPWFVQVFNAALAAAGFEKTDEPVGLEQQIQFVVSL